MDEELIILENEIIETEINTEDIEQSVETKETIEMVEIENAEEIEIEVDEAIGWVGGDSTKHYSLYGRDEPDQHPIKAITGLREELNQIEALQTVYSDKKLQADYYLWRQDYDHSLPENPYGLFVSVYKNTDKIQICDGASDVFGVTVAEAGFVGGQQYNQAEGGLKTGRDGNYCLVVHSGLVSVRCETTIAVGDYATSNSRGEAKKTDGKYGYLVTALSEVNGVKHAVISLNTPSTLTKTMANDIQDLSGRMSTAEYNITSVTNVANSAYALAQDAKENAEVNSEYLEEKIEEVLGKMDAVDGIVGDLNESVNNANTIAVLAKAIAESAISSAEAIRDEAVKSSNEAVANVKDLMDDLTPITEWKDSNNPDNTGAQYYTAFIEDGIKTKVDIETFESKTEEAFSAINRNAKSVTSLMATIDKYCVGEHSQAYGLTSEQAISTLSNGMVYVPTIMHTETYDESYIQEFLLGYYYTWDGKKWVPSLSTAVSFLSVYFSGNEQTPYWVVTISDIIYNNITYDLGGLYLWENGAWVKVASTADNTLSRAVSAIKQTADSIALEVTNVNGDMAGVKSSIAETKTSVQSLASWAGKDGKRNLATIQQTADDGGARMALVVVKDSEDAEDIELGGARIILNDSEKGSYIAIDADNIVMTGTTTFVTPEDLGEDGTTEIYGGRIATHTITSDHISVNNLSTLSANIGTVNTGLIQSKCGPKIWGSEEVVEEDNNDNNNYYDYDGYSEGLSYTLINNETEYEVSGIGTCADTNIQIPSSYNGKSVTSIASRAFENCNSLTGIIIPDSVTSIGDAAFLGCPIETAIIPTIAIKSILNNVLTTVILTSGTSIGDETFKGCNSLKSIVIGSSIETIGHSAFYYCFSLQSITISNGVISIGDDAFHSCTSLENITIPDSVTSIGDYAFIDCRSLKSVTIGNGVTSIGENAFKICNQLKSVIFKEDSKLENIGDYAFRSCRSLKSIVIPNSVKSINNYAFYNCYSLTIYCEVESDIYTNEENSKWNYSKCPVYYYSPTHKEGRWYYGNGGIRIESTNFNVTNEGILSATHANIEGTITVETGSDIAGWKTDSTKLYNNNVGLYSGDDNLDYTLIESPTNPQSPVRFYAGGDSLITAPFRVLEDGSLYASAANIEGNITATKGSIGNLTINSTNNGYALYCYGNNNEILYHLDQTGLFFGDNSQFKIGNVTFKFDDEEGQFSMSTQKEFIIKGGGGSSIRLNNTAGSSHFKSYAQVKLDGVYQNMNTGKWQVHFTLSFYTTVGSEIINDKGLFYDEDISVNIKINDSWGTTFKFNRKAGDKLESEGFVEYNIKDLKTLSIYDTSSAQYVQLVPQNLGPITVKTIEQREVLDNIAFTANLLPDGAVAKYSLGQNGRLWKQVFAENTTISTSDRNEKENILSLSDQYSKLFDKLQPVSYKLIQNDSDRTHIGFIAQDIEQSLIDVGLTTKDFAGICYWDKEDGTKGYGLRYGEFIALNTMEIQKLKARVAELENKLQTQQND